MTVIGIINLLRTRNNRMQVIMRQILLVAARFQFEIRAELIKDHPEIVSYWLARWESHEESRRAFLQWNQVNNLREIVVPSHMLQLNDNW